MLLLNLLKNTWARSVKAVTTIAMPKAFADDAGALNKNSENIDIALKITGRFATVTQQKLNVDKTKVWGTTEETSTRTESNLMLSTSSNHLGSSSSVQEE